MLLKKLSIVSFRIRFPETTPERLATSPVGAPEAASTLTDPQVQGNANIIPARARGKREFARQDDGAVLHCPDAVGCRLVRPGPLHDHWPGWWGSALYRALMRHGDRYSNLRIVELLDKSGRVGWSPG